MKFGLKVLVGLTFTAAAALGAASAAQAQAIPYPTPGVVNPLTYTVTPTGGTVTFTFYSSDASDSDYVGLFQNGVQLTDTISGNQWVLENHSTSQGTQATFNVTAGQPVVLAEWNATTSTQFFSIPGLNPDGDQHAYLAAVSAGQLFTASPAGYYVGWEDLTAAQSGDFDYNDTQIIVSGVLATPGPVPGTGVVGLALLALYGAFQLRRA